MLAEDWQKTVDWLAKEIQLQEHTQGSRIDLDWGNYQIECSNFPTLKEALIKMAKEYLRLKGLK